MIDSISKWIDNNPNKYFWLVVIPFIIFAHSVVGYMENI